MPHRLRAVTAILEPLSRHNQNVEKNVTFWQNTYVMVIFITTVIIIMKGGLVLDLTQPTVLMITISTAVPQKLWISATTSDGFPALERVTGPLGTLVHRQ